LYSDQEWAAAPGTCNTLDLLQGGGGEAFLRGTGEIEKVENLVFSTTGALFTAAFLTFITGNELFSFLTVFSSLPLCLDTSPSASLTSNF
jgi:hypothetical protein